ncbi:MAG: hypothetical protein HZB41_14120 [Ignavibacteriae bacterium]|nr:hypothetical protein [Ignavibacteriota bacterium]
MKFNPDIHHRNTIRLKGYDYSKEGDYYITICTKNREKIFGEIDNNSVRLNDAGLMIEKWYKNIENKFKNVKCDFHIIMPNHIHGIIQIVGADLCVCPDIQNEYNKIETQGEHIGSPLHRIIQWFKTLTTNEYIRNVKNNNWNSFNGRLWQRNYYERIIRNEIEYYKIRDYILNNPLNWKIDDYF